MNGSIELSNFDILLPGLPVVFCGINPNIEAARSGQNFASASNRFWPVLLEAGFTPSRLSSQEDRFLLKFGCGLTAVATRGTRRADELRPAELTSGHELLREKIGYFQPTFLAFLGKAAYAAVAESPQLDWGPQRSRYVEAQVWVLPNPSGLNRAFTFRSLVEHYVALREQADPALRAWRKSHDPQTREATAR